MGWESRGDGTYHACNLPVMYRVDEEIAEDTDVWHDGSGELENHCIRFGARWRCDCGTLFTFMYNRTERGYRWVRG